MRQVVSDRYSPAVTEAERVRFQLSSGDTPAWYTGTARRACCDTGRARNRFGWRPEAVSEPCGGRGMGDGSRVDGDSRLGRGRSQLTQCSIRPAPMWQAVYEPGAKLHTDTAEESAAPAFNLTPVGVRGRDRGSLADCPARPKCNDRLRARATTTGGLGQTLKYQTKGMSALCRRIAHYTGLYAACGRVSGPQSRDIATNYVLTSQSLEGPSPFTAKTNPQEHPPPGQKKKM